MDVQTFDDLRKHASQPPEVMIFGSGACAQKIALNLAEHGIDVWLSVGDTPAAASDQHDGIHWLTETELNWCRGFAGNFELELKQAHALLHKNVPSIVVAENDSRSANYVPYGLTPESRVLTISALEERLDQSTTENIACEGRIVFLCGWQNNSHPTIAQRMLDGCLQLQNYPGANTFFMTGNLKVSATGSEMRVQEAKRSGTVFLKFTYDFPNIQQQVDGHFTIDYLDELTRTLFQFEADWIVVDETIVPAGDLAALAKKLGIDCDGIGFAQGDNVRRMSNATNRHGIFVAGGSRGILSATEQLADADQVSLSVLAFLQDLDADTLPLVEIQQGRCARCLTCFRLCPHMAIEIDTRITVNTAACQSCGLCMAGCPARAIEMKGVRISDEVSRHFKQPAVGDRVADRHLQIIVFGCARSAGHAYSLPGKMGQSLPEGVQFVEVPCGGAISTRHLLAAFEAGADGVMLCTCHTDNCQSVIGNKVARKRSDGVRDLLTAAGLESDRLRTASVAANMSTEFALMVKDFVDQIDVLNGSSLY